jgi:branched-chain amino acid transport system permease protein
VQLLRTAGRLAFGDRGPSHVVVSELIWLALVLLYPLLFAGVGLSFGNNLIVFSLLALSLELCWGVAGIINIGQAAFFGIGAYATAVLSAHNFQNGAELTLISVGLAAGAGAIIGAFLFSGRRDVGIWYVALATIAVTYGAEQFVRGTTALGADSGIPNVVVDLPFIPDSGTPASYYCLVVILVVTYLACRRLLTSRIGTVLRALREDPERLASLGYPVQRYRIAVFAASAGLAGLAGALLAASTGFVSPGTLGLGLSAEALIWLLIGGRGLLIGGIIGAWVLELAGFQLSDAFPIGWQLGLGALIVVFVVLLPNGLLGMARTALVGARLSARATRRYIWGVPVPRSGSG